MGCCYGLFFSCILEIEVFLRSPFWLVQVPSFWLAARRSRQALLARSNIKKEEESSLRSQEFIDATVRIYRDRPQFFVLTLLRSLLQ
jgi:hypothetical protein